MSGVGGYMRRSERVKARILDPIRAERSRFELSYQSMPVLSFEPFIIKEDDSGIYLDADGMQGLRSDHGHRQRPGRH